MSASPNGDAELPGEEAGGRFSDFAGRSTPAGGNALSTNGLLHDEVLGLLRPP